MFLFILESIGTSELILIGIVALVFLGPRKLPEIARKIGKITSEFRGTASEFKQTWEREVSFEDEAKALDLNTIESEAVARDATSENNTPPVSPAAPAIKSMDPADFEHLVPTGEPVENLEEETVKVDSNDKKNWL